MFGVGSGEILVILLVALLLLGPNEIPKVARTVGKTMKELQRFKDDLRRSVDMEFEEYERTHSKKTEKDSDSSQENKEQLSDN